jgi:hypothetical protein
MRGSPASDEHEKSESADDNQEYVHGFTPKRLGVAFGPAGYLGSKYCAAI